MTIQDLGSIGELIAAIATVATLIYLAVQIRANTTALRIEARRAESLSKECDRHLIALSVMEMITSTCVCVCVEYRTLQWNSMWAHAFMSDACQLTESKSASERTAKRLQ